MATFNHCRLTIALILMYSAYGTTDLDQFDIVRATNAACFNAQFFIFSTIFNAPQNGTIAGIQLNYINGSVNCDDDLLSSSPSTYWGCSKNRLGFFTMFLRVTDAAFFTGELYYPQNTTQDIQFWADPSWPPDVKNHSDCQCNLGIYNLTTANASNSPSFHLINPLYNVTTNDQFMLQYLKACCPTYFRDGTNFGTTCASVDFLYS